MEKKDYAHCVVCLPCQQYVMMLAESLSMRWTSVMRMHMSMYTL